MNNNTLDSETSLLLCTEVLDLSELTRTPEHQSSSSSYPTYELCPYPELPLTVQAQQDDSQVRDHRVLQNLLRNEDKYLPPASDYFRTVQAGALSSSMRKTVAEWMLEVVHEQNSQPEVFCQAMNVMDRFLCRCRILKSQLQLLGSVCLLVSSKIREACSIPGKTLITYTDNSITAEELKEWELLVLHKLQWELTAITPLDYLDHTIPRLALPDLSPEELVELRRRTETILVICATEYQFVYNSQSLMASAAILIAIRSLSRYSDAVLREIRLRLQTVTHTATGHLDYCTKAICDILPGYLKSVLVRLPPTPADSSSELKHVHSMSTPTKECADSTTELQQSVALSSPELMCKESLSSDSAEDDDFEGLIFPAVQSPDDGEGLGYSLSPSSRSSSPLSAVDIFTEYNTNILQAVFEQAESSMDAASYSILVS